MSELSVTNVTSSNSSTNLVLQTGNPSSGAIIVGTDSSLTIKANSSVNAFIANTTGTHFASNVNIISLLANGSLGSASQVLTSNGSQTYWGTVAASPSISKYKVTTYATGTGTFTRDANTVYATVYCTGGGGGGGAADSDSTSSTAAGGGGAGGTAIKYYLAAELGATASYAVGIAGVAGTGNGGNGGTGGTSTFTPTGTGGAITGVGGNGGTGSGSAYGNTWSAFNGGSGGVSTGGDISHDGLDGFAGTGYAGPGVAGGNGGGSFWGGGANGPTLNGNGIAAGVAGTVAGGGGSGAINTNNTTSQNGGAGFAGRITVVEFLSG